MPTAKRKASASPAASDTNDDPAELEIDQPLDDDLVEAGPSSPHKRAHASSSSSLQTLDSDLRRLPLDILEPLLPLQKRLCLGTLVGSLPPLPTEPSQPIASTSTLAADEDEDAAVFTDQVPSKDVDENARLQAGACVGLEEEWHTLHGMLHATVKAQESNSCLLIGASGSGKSLLIDSALESIRNTDSGGASADDKPYYHVRLAGTVQINDRSAMKEMAQQLILQGAFTEEDVGDAIDSPALDDEDEDGVQSRTAPAGDHVFGGDADDEEEDEAAQLAAAAAAADEQVEIQDELAGAILSSLNNIIAHIIALLSNTSSNVDSNPRAGRKPLIITLDDFDLFTARPRQAMLYCLLDAVQAASYGAGLAVVGLTSRVDTVDLLEKRVKSRFSHRILHVRPPATYEIFERIVRNALAPLSAGSKALVSIPRTHVETFVQAWQADFDRLLSHQHFRDVLRGIYELSNDIRMVYRILIPTISSLTLLSPSIDLPTLLSTAATEVSDGIIHILRDLTEPELALLIAIKHLQTRDRQIFNFEMCYDELRRFASRDARERQAASSAEGGIAGGGGGVAVSTPFFADRKIALMSFHSLLSLEIVLPENWVSTLTVSNPVAKPSAAPSAVGRSNQSTIRKEFWKVRCILPPQVIVTAVKDRQRQVAISSSLVKWATSHG